MGTNKWSWPTQDTLRFWFDAAVAFATVIGVVFLILQWRQTQHALATSREANRIALNAARESNRIATESLRVTQRPWVVPKAATVYVDRTGFHGTVTLTNSGISPALGVMVFPGYGINPSKTRELQAPAAPGKARLYGPNNPLPPPDPTRDRITLRPDGELVVPAEVSIQPSEWDALQSGEMIAKFIVAVTYSDALSRDSVQDKYTTKVCYVTKSTAKSQRFEMIPCVAGNRAD